MKPETSEPYDFANIPRGGGRLVQVAVELSIASCDDEAVNHFVMRRYPGRYKFLRTCRPSGYDLCAPLRRRQTPDHREEIL